jgi:protein-S-isoprenylcysteine O-methyltransferase Ste14
MVKSLTWSVILLVHGGVTVIVPYLLLHASTQLLTDTLGGFRWSGLALIIIGAVGILWSGWSLTLAGKGTPAPFDPPKQFVVRGLYRFVRNPMYGGDMLVLFGESVLFGSALLLLYAGVMLCVFHSFIVFYEEPTLERQFGDSYEQYRSVVSRWIPNRIGSRSP